MVCTRSGSGIAAHKEGLKGQLKELEIWYEEFAVHKLDDRPDHVRAPARAPLTEDGVCGLEDAENPILMFMSLLLSDWMSCCERVGQLELGTRVSWGSMTHVDEISPDASTLQTFVTFLALSAATPGQACSQPSTAQASSV
jgi:hypothetical protein